MRNILPDDMPKGEEELHDQQFGNHHHLRLLAENVPGLMTLLINKNHTILCSVGNETLKQKEDGKQNTKQRKMLEEQLPESIIKILLPLLKIAFEGTSVSREFTYNNDYYSVRLNPVSEQKNSDLCVIILQNITENKIIEEKLKISKKVAEEANDEKSAFIAKMSHEIRTPLNAIIGFTEQLTKTKLTKKQSTYLGIVKNSSYHLLSTIDDILVISKIESGQTEVENEPFSIEEVINTVKDIFTLSFKEKKLDFHINCDPSVNEMLLGDSAKIRQVLINLIANAIKFTHEGGILLSCTLIKQTSEKLTIRFDIADSGIGMVDGDLKSIFEPFHQVDDTKNSIHHGSGLGLTISNNQVKAMGGEIVVKSSPTKGSTFSFTLTFQKVSTQLPERNTDTPPPSPILSNHVRILFTDDDLMSRMLGKVILNQHKTTCVFACSGKEAIKEFKPGHFDIVILDINMPDMSGVDVAKHIRNIESSNKKLPRTKIIAITANVLKKHVKEYLSAGMDDVISKPFSESDLIKKIAIHSAGKNPIHAESKKIGKPLSGDKDYDLNELLQITKNDKAFTLLMLDTFLENTKGMLKHMQQSFNKGDYPAIAEAAHRLHPSVEQLGFKKTSSMLKRIESRYLRKRKFEKDPEMIEISLHEVASCIEKISLARDDFP